MSLKSWLLIIICIIIAIIFGVVVGLSLSIAHASVNDYYYQQWYVEIPQQLTDWQSMDELKEFLDEDDTDRHRFIKLNSDGRGKFNKSCVDLAEHLRDKATEYGKHLEVLVITTGEYNRVFGKSKSAYHAINLARIGDYYYAIEPDNDIVKKAYKIP